MLRSRSEFWVSIRVGIAAWLLCLVPATEAQSLGQKWKQADREAVDSLLAGDHDKARKELNRVLDEMVERMGPGLGGELAMGLVLMHRALAEAGLGRHREALWDWHVALNFNPSLADEDLSRFGEAGRLLEENPLREPDLGESAEAEASAMARPLDGEIDPPKARKKPRPKFPRGARDWGIEGPIVIQMIITPEGEAIQPVVLKDLEAATITYSALEALRDWKFQPARLGGEPIAVFYNLAVNYELPWKDG